MCSDHSNQTHCSDTHSDRAIARDFLDASARAIMDDDFAAWADRILVPVVVRTRAEEIIRKDRAGLKLSFEKFRRTIVAHKVTDFFQTIDKVERVGPEALLIIYQTELLSKGQLALPIFTNWVYLRLVDDVWRMEQMLSGVSNTAASHFITVDPAGTNPLI